MHIVAAAGSVTSRFPVAIPRESERKSILYPGWTAPRAYPEPPLTKHFINPEGGWSAEQKCASSSRERIQVFLDIRIAVAVCIRAPSAGSRDRVRAPVPNRPACHHDRCRSGAGKETSSGQPPTACCESINPCHRRGRSRRTLRAGADLVDDALVDRSRAKEHPGGLEHQFGRRLRRLSGHRGDDERIVHAERRFRRLTVGREIDPPFQLSAEMAGNPQTKLPEANIFPRGSCC